MGQVSFLLNDLKDWTDLDVTHFLSVLLGITFNILDSVTVATTSMIFIAFGITFNILDSVTVATTSMIFIAYILLVWSIDPHKSHDPLMALFKRTYLKNHLVLPNLLIRL